MSAKIWAFSWLAFAFSIGNAISLPAQETDTGSAATAAEANSEDLKAPEAVGIEPTAEDVDIAGRLQNIFEATKWFNGASVRVDEGVVFLSGVSGTEEHRQWAGNLARNTQDVVAVVNRITVAERSIWDLSPAWLEMRKLGRETIQAIPLLLLAIVLISISCFASYWSVEIAKTLLARRLKNRLLTSVLSRTTAIPVFMIGLYFALRVSGLTQIAATVIGGTGLIGLVIGIAFRDIAENFLASILISIQRPFALGDQIQVLEYEGIVQSVTARETLLMSLDGNHVQIPNSSIYKSIICNKTANPNVRCEFTLGIDYGDSVVDAQRILLAVLNTHSAVLNKPEPLVVVEELGSATVNLRILFWIDGQQHSKLKVRSSVIRLSKVAIEEAGLTMPDESREIIFPHGVPVTVSETGKSQHRLPSNENAGSNAKSAPHADTNRDKQVVSQGEGDLASEQQDLEEQARLSRSPEQGENLLAN